MVMCSTTKGHFTINVTSSWAPVGAERFLDLVRDQYYTQVPFFRVVPKFITQFGIPLDRDMILKWRNKGSIQDDPKIFPTFCKGCVSFAGSGPNSRHSQIFIAYEESTWLGNSPWETPFGQVIQGLDVLESLKSYGEIPPWGTAPDQGRIAEEGEPYLKQDYPELDYLQSCEVVADVPVAPEPASGNFVRGHAMLLAMIAMACLLIAIISFRLSSRHKTD